MSNIFGPLVRPFGTLPVLVESGPAVGHTEYMHMLVADNGALLCSNNAIHHYGAAVPFDTNGRVVVSEAAVARWDQDIPFTASGAVAMKASPDLAHWDQGLIFTDTGHIATGDVEPPPEAPVWSEIPDTQNFLYELPQTYDVSPYVSEAGDPITGFALITPPDFFTIDNAGVVTAGVGTADGAHVLTVEATNGVGSSTTTFTWTLETGNVPTWDPIPTQQHRQNELPKTLDVKPYASSDSGPILTYSLVGPPAGITMANGVVTVAAGTAVSSYLLTVRATNGVGAGDTTFTWTVLETLIAPVWSTIPNQTDTQDALPETLDVSPYVTSNAGALRNWQLITPPAGFTIDQAGIVTASAGIVIADHTVVVQVENDIGSASSSFLWMIQDTLLPPQWQTIPNQNTLENLLPTILDVSTFASSNSGPLTGWSLVTPPTGFSINGSGVITVAAGTAVAVHTLTVEVTNDTGTTSSAPFDWEIELFYLPPQWSTIPDQTNGDDELPVDFDVSPYVTTNSGPLTAWTLVTPPAGFTIDVAGVITVAAGTAPGSYDVTVSVSNDEGAANSDAFAWTISSVLLPPQWSTIPTQTTREDALPATLNAALWVSTNSGPLTGWELVSPPAGFSIDAAGLITVAAGVAPSGYSVQVRVTNNTGTASSNIFTWNIDSFFLVPQWSTIPNQATEEQLLPVVLDVKPYVSSNHGSLTNWSLVAPPGGWTISADGIITVAAARPVGSNQITVRVDNDSGSADSAAFTWDILEEPLPPQWSPIPTRQDREDTLPQNYDISGYVTTNSGALTGWALVTPPTGFTINGAGVITAAAGTAVAAHSLTVRVSNDEGSSDSAAFTWEVQEELLLPQWQTVPGKSDRINVLPQNYDMSFYVTSNAGALILWRLATSPSGFSINSSTGVITGTAGAGIGDHTLRVGVTNSLGESLSNTFQWEILEELLPPQWQTIPNKTTAYEDLPDTYDVSSYVSSNSGPLDTWSLVAPPAGFTIDQSGVITAATNAVQAANSITVRVFNDEGGADKTFTWTVEAPVSVAYFHEFNADLGGFTHTRASNATRERYDDTNIWDTVGVDAPVYAGCSFNGSIYTPTAGWSGLVIEHESTNYVRQSRDLTGSSWEKRRSSATSATSFSTTGFNGGVIDSNTALSNSRMLASVDALAITNDQTIFNWSYIQDGQELDLPINSSNYSYHREEFNAGSSAGLTLASAIFGVGNQYGGTHFQAESDNGRNFATSRIINDSSSSNSVRAVSDIVQTVGDMGLPPDTASLHAGQVKLYMDHTGNSSEQYVLAFAVSDASSDYAFLLAYGGGSYRTYQRIGGVNTGGLSYTLSLSDGDFIDVRWKVIGSQRLKWWINGAHAGTDSASLGAWQQTPGNIHAGNILSGSDFPAFRLHTVRLEAGDISDSEILAWA